MAGNQVQCGQRSRWMRRARSLWSGRGGSCTEKPLVRAPAARRNLQPTGGRGQESAYIAISNKAQLPANQLAATISYPPVVSALRAQAHKLRQATTGSSEKLHCGGALSPNKDQVWNLHATLAGGYAGLRNFGAQASHSWATVAQDSICSCLVCSSGRLESRLKGGSFAPEAAVLVSAAASADTSERRMGRTGTGTAYKQAK